MSDFYFFTDLDLLEDCIPGISGQTNNDYYGKQDSFGGKDRFMVSSVFKRKSTSTDSIFAYAVCEGQVMFDKQQSPAINHGTLVLKPTVQPKSVTNLDLPDIKYIIYRGLKYDELVGSGVNPTITASPTNDPIELRKYINTTHVGPGSPSADAIKSRLLPEIIPGIDNLDTPISYSFKRESNTNLSVYPKIAGGTCIGEFHPGAFSIEIIFDSPDYEPDVKHLRSVDPVRCYIEDSPMGTNDFDRFVNRKKRDVIRHFIAPSAFFGAFYGSNLFVKKNILAPAVKLSLDPANSDGNLNQVMAKFFNRNVYYLDIRNKYNYSYNFYRFVSDLPAGQPNSKLFPKYEDDLEVLIENSGSVNSIARSYYSNDWPILIIRNDDYLGAANNDFSIGTIGGQVNRLNLKLKKGNNDSPKAYLASGYGVYSYSLSTDWIDIKLQKDEKFIVLEEDSTFFKGISLLMPIENGSTNIVSSYSRIIYIKKVTPKNVSSTAEDERLFDNYIKPLELKGPNTNSNNLLSYTYNDAVYINLEPNDLNSEFYGGVSFAVDNKNVTIAFFPVHKQRGSATEIKQALVSLTGTNVSEYLADVDNQFLKDKLLSENLTISLETPQVLSFALATSSKTSPYTDSAVDDLVAFVIEKSNYQQILTEIDAQVSLYGSSNSTGFTDILPISIVIRDRNDWDGNTANDEDDMGKKYVSFKIYLQGFNKSSADEPQVYEHNTGVTLYGKSEDFDNNIYIDKDTTVDLSSKTGLFQTVEPSLSVNLNLSDAESPAKQIHDQIRNSVSQDSSKRYYLDNPEVTELFNTFYRDDLRDFIYQLYEAGFSAAFRSGASTTATTDHYPSFLLYKHVFSRFINLSPTIYTSSTNSAGGAPAPIFQVQKPVFLGGPSAANIQLNFNAANNFEIKNTSTLHQGFLLEASNALAIYFLAKRLEFFTKDIAGDRYDSGAKLHLSWLKHNKGAKNNTEGLDFTITEQFTPIVREFPIINNLFKVLDDHSFEIPGYSATYGFTYDDVYKAFYELFTESATYKDTIRRLIQLKNNNFTSTTTSLSGDVIYPVLQAWYDMKQLMVKKYTLLFYDYFKNLDPTIKINAGEDFEIFNISTGDGSTTVALFGKEEGTSLFYYEVDDTNNSSSDTITLINWEAPGSAIGLMEPKHSVTRSKTFPSVVGMNYVFHMALFGLEGNGSGLSINDQIFAYRGTTLISPSFNFQRMSNSYTKLSPSPWIESVGTSALLGTYNEPEKDLTVFDKTIDKLEYKATAGSNETSRFFCFFRQLPSKIFFAKNHQDPFGDDQFLLANHSTNTYVIWSNGNPNLQKLISFIRDADAIEISMKGGMVGKKSWPARYSNLYTYPVDHVVFYENKVYKALVPATDSPLGSSQWEPMEFNSGINYNQGDFIYTKYVYSRASGSVPSTFEITRIFKALTTVSSGGTEPTSTDANWKLIAESYNEDLSYYITNRVIYDGYIQECIYDLSTELFDQEKWIHVHRLESDEDYQHKAALNFIPVNHETGAQTDPSVIMTNAEIRATMGYILYDSVTNKIIINIESYASPVRSTLFDGLPNLNDPANAATPVDPEDIARFNALDLETIWGQNEDLNSDNANARVTTGGASYNQVLTALRCWGLLWSITKEIQLEADAILGSTDTTIESKLNIALDLAKVVTVAETTTDPPDNSITNLSYIDKTKFKFLAGL